MIRPWILGLVLGVLVTACGPNVGPSPSPGPTDAPPASPTIAASPPASVGPVGSAVNSPVGSPVGSGAASAGASPAVPIDPSLLAILPATVGGQPISEVQDVEVNLATDPSLVANAAGLAVALGIDLGAGEFAYVAVIRLKPLVFSNAFFLSWRQSYDEGACSQSNGLKSTSATTIAGRPVFVGTCNGGAVTYHVHLAAPDRLVSITSVGTSQYGALVLAGLKP